MLRSSKPAGAWPTRRPCPANLPGRASPGRRQAPWPLWAPPGRQARSSRSREARPARPLLQSSLSRHRPGEPAIPLAFLPLFHVSIWVMQQKASGHQTGRGDAMHGGVAAKHRVARQNEAPQSLRGTCLRHRSPRPQSAQGFASPPPSPAGQQGGQVLWSPQQRSPFSSRQPAPWAAPESAVSPVPSSVGPSSPPPCLARCITPAPCAEPCLRSMSC
jgi:hypothetical protein